MLAVSQTQPKPLTILYCSTWSISPLYFHSPVKRSISQAHHNPQSRFPPPSITLPNSLDQPSYEPLDKVALSSFGPTLHAPLGSIVHGRSGDKGSNCNVGFFPKHDKAWPWLRSFLTTNKLIELLADDYHGHKIERMEFCNIHAVHFLLRDWLDRGVSANTTYDILGKFLAEYIRCKHVDIPTQFLAMGTI